jgi:sugar lactone lactonase YvrE
MNRRNILACLLVVAVGVPIAARAEHTRYWRQTDFSEFEKGTAHGVAIRSDGKLAPAPKFDSFADPNLAYVWAVRLDSRNRLYAAGGSDAKVIRFDDSGKGTTVFESQELVAQALAFDAKDNLYVGTSPDGKVYQVTPDGKKSVFFDPKTKYIWALAFDSHGTLFVATGDKGQVFAIEPDGKGQLFYQSQERHARSLAFDEKNNLLIGTEPDGLILRVPIERKTPQSAPTAGAPFVIYETSKAEVTSLLTDASGNIYAASIGEKNQTPMIQRIIAPPAVSPTTVPATNTTNSTIVIGGQTQTTQPQQQSITSYSFPPISSTGGAEVVKIAPDGSPDTIWTSRDDLVFAMGLPPTGKILLGTGNAGAIVQIEDNDVYANVVKAESAQVTGFAVAPDGRVFVATANPGKIFTLGPGYATDGSFESNAFDAKIFSRWGRITWWGENGATEGKVALYVRSGNTSNPGENWSAWAGPYKDAKEAEPDCPPARFVQWKAVFVDTDKGLPPDVSWVSLAYQPRNVAPVIDDIAIQDPGIRVVGFPMQSSGPGTAVPVQLRYPHSTGGVSFATVSAENMNQGSQIEVPPQGFRDKSYQSVLWSAHDDNDDDLVFSVYYRGEGEHNWRLLKDKLAQKYYSWDTTTMPDGAYYMKIVASDSPSNPVDQARSAERESDRFQVANTPPQIVNLRAGSGLLNTKASWDATSSAGAIARAEYSIDSGDWKILFPTDLLSDSSKESYYVQLPGLPPGEHTLAVQVTDRFNNTTAAKVTFTVEPHGVSQQHAP